MLRGEMVTGMTSSSLTPLHLSENWHLQSPRWSALSLDTWREQETESGRGSLELASRRSPDTWEVPEGGRSWQPPWPPSQVQVSVRGPPRLTFSVLSVVNIPLVSFTRQEVGENRRRRNNINVSLKGSTYNRFENTI